MEIINKEISQEIYSRCLHCTAEEMEVFIKSINDRTVEPDEVRMFFILGTILGRIRIDFMKKVANTGKSKDMLVLEQISTIERVLMKKH